MWTRMMVMMVGRVTIAVVLALLGAVLAYYLGWHGARLTSEYGPGVVAWVDGALAYASERLGWLWDWLVHQF